jgi:ribosomal protein L44E
MVRKTKKGFKLVIRCDVCGKEDTRDIIGTCGQRFCNLCRDNHERDLFDKKETRRSQMMSISEKEILFKCLANLKGFRFHACFREKNRKDFEV